ncbi:MAG: mechanosensitive ion channel [Lawsonella sp.]|uniref:mechanosensitive ion channel family protein n=1 Tax=Lawsonella sp. TaxID=2041415 RepID=UPI002A751F86|nr:mechanosensitive ion channel domain-containing protein [Lawsonella sp.]MDY2978503.1 mechanosensitive ion channel [Lawsonella sp.]
MSNPTWASILSWLGTQGIQILLIVIGSILLARLAGFVSRRVTRSIAQGEENRDSLVQSETAKHRYAVAQVITYVVVALIVVVAAVGVVDRLGISLTTLVAPATVLGAALGFGAQRVVQDFLAGFFVVTERHYGYGDVVTIWVTGCSEPAKGTVEDVTLRITRVRTADGEVVTVPNGQIVKTINRSKDWARAVVDVPVRNQDIGPATHRLHELCDDIINDQQFRDLLLDKPTVIGVEEIGAEETVLRIVARSLPGKQFEVSRELRVRVAHSLAGLGVDSDKVQAVGANGELSESVQRSEGKGEDA